MNQAPVDEEIAIVCAIALDPTTQEWAREMRIGHKVIEHPLLAEVYSAVYGHIDVMSDTMAANRRAAFLRSCKFENLEAALLHYSGEAFTRDHGLLCLFQRFAWERFDRWGIDALEWATKRVKAGDRGDVLWRASVVLAFAASDLRAGTGVWVYNSGEQKELEYGR